MRTPFWLIALVLAAAGGVAVGYAITPQPRANLDTPELADSPDDNQADASSPLTSQDDEQSDAQLRETRPDREPADDDGASAKVEAKVEKEVDDLLDKMDDLELPTIATGDGTITGRLVDAEGRPVSGVGVGLHHSSMGVTVTMPNRDDYETDDEYLRAYLKVIYISKKARLRPPPTRTSGANGEVVFDGLPEGSCRLRLKDDHFLINGRHSTYIGEFKVGDSFEIEVVRACPVSVTVNGVPKSASGCQLEWSPVSDGCHGGSVSFKPGKAKIVYLPEGDHDITAEVYRPNLAGGPHRVTVTPSDTPQQVELSVRRNASVYGTVRFPDIRPQHYSVRAVKVFGDATDEELLRSSRGVSSVSARLNRSSGEYHFERGMHGQYVIGVLYGSRDVLESTRVTIGDEPIELDLQVTLPPHRGTLKVIVKRPAGNEDINESVRVSHRQSGRRLLATVWTDDDGNYLFLFKEPDPNYPWPDSAYVTARNGELGFLTAPFTPGTDREITIEFVEPVEVHVRIKNLPETFSWANLSIQQAPHFDASPSSKHLRPGNAASKAGARLGMYQPGEYRFQMNRHGSHSFPYGTHSAVVKSGAEEQQIVIELPELYSVKIDGSNCAPYVHADLKHLKSGFTDHFTFNDSHTALFTNLAAGEYEVTYRANGAQGHGKKRTMKFTLPGTETVVLTE